MRAHRAGESADIKAPGGCSERWRCYDPERGHICGPVTNRTAAIGADFVERFRPN